MNNKEKYKIRLYITDSTIGNTINVLVRTGVLDLKNSFDGKGNILAIYDVLCDLRALEELIRMGVKYFPLNNYKDFIIVCPECGERIDDDMILTTYDDALLSGYNIACGCGLQMADIILDLYENVKTDLL